MKKNLFEKTKISKKQKNQKKSKTHDFFGFFSWVSLNYILLTQISAKNLAKFITLLQIKFSMCLFTNSRKKIFSPSNTIFHTKEVQTKYFFCIVFTWQAMGTWLLQKIGNNSANWRKMKCFTQFLGFYVKMSIFPFYLYCKLTI